MSTQDLILIPLVAFAVTAVSMPIVRRLAIRIGDVDKPKEEVRKLHKIIVPNGAGLAIFLGFLVAVLLLGGSNQISALLVAGLVMVIAGLLDEMFNLSAATRLICQMLAAMIVVAAGVKVDFIGNFGNGNDGLFFLGDWSIPFTIAWIVGVTNAIRIIDGLDGLAAGVTGIGSLSVGIVSLLTGRPDVAILCFILTAAAFAYLPYNFSNNPKRKIFMADAGSTFLGFALAVVSIMGSVKTATTFSMFVPIIALIVPIFDTIFAIVRRLVAKQSPFKADGLHLHHRLVNKGLSHHQTVGVFYGASILLGLIAVTSVGMSGRNVLVLFIILLAIFIFGLWRLGLLAGSSRKK